MRFCSVVKIRRDWALLCLLLALFLFFEWRRGDCYFEAKGWQTYGAGW